jgi:hypothetical protein
MKVKLLTKDYIPLLEAAFAPFYAKPASIFEKYLQEKDRKVWVTYKEIARRGFILDTAIQTIIFWTALSPSLLAVSSNRLYHHKA